MLLMNGLARLRRRLAFASIMACALLAAPVLHADVTVPEEYSKHVEGAKGVQMLGEGLFGDNVSLYDGSTAFSVTDLSLQGSGLVPVEVKRSFKVYERADYKYDGLFGDWELDLPYLSGTFAKRSDSGARGWTVSVPGNKYQRCSITSPLHGMPPDAASNTSGQFEANSYWNGNRLHLPGGGSQEMLVLTPGSANRPTSRGPYYWVTADYWYFSCLNNTANGVPGEAFEARSPDGTTYRFDWFVDRRVPSLKGEVNAGGVGLKGSSPSATKSTTVSKLFRKEVRIYPTLITDRFGNSVTYTYDPAYPERLKTISSNDGLRVISISYGGNGKISMVSGGGSSYGYAYNGSALQGVQRPDGSTWSYSLQDLVGARIARDPSVDPGIGGSSYYCERSSALPTQSTYTGTITHPSGAVGAFSVRPTVHGRSWVVKDCIMPGGVDGRSDHAKDPFLFETLSIISKKITGPGLGGGYNWGYSYGPPNNSWKVVCQASGCPASKTVTVAGNGESTTYVFGNRFRWDEGQLLSTQKGNASNGRVETLSYSALGPIGTSPYESGDQMQASPRPLSAKVIRQQNTNFTWSAGGFDAFANPTSVSRSGPGGTRSETLTYENDLSGWVLGNVKSVKMGSQVISETSYNGCMMPVEEKSFGRVVRSYQWYCAGGDLASVADAGGMQTSYANYKLGVPQRVTLPNGSIMTATVGNGGEINSVTDPLEKTTTYSYDSMLRLTGIYRPSGSVTGSTLLSLALVPSVEYGLTAGHWKGVERTGSYTKTVYYDAFMRPVIVQEEGGGDKQFTVNSYDHANRLVFAGRPQEHLSSYAGGSAGVWTYYDHLGRPTSQSEFGGGTTLFEYLSGFRTKITNPRGKVTTVNYQAWDQPTTEFPTGFLRPLGGTISISRDSVWGKPMSVSQGGINRRFIYDNYLRLCMRYDPESSWTVFNYDASDNLTLKAPGQEQIPSSNTACIRTSLNGEGAQYTYDALGNVTNVAAGGTSRSFGYNAAGQMTSASSNGGTWNFTLSADGKVTWGDLTVDGKTFEVGYGYNSAGHVSSLGYPDGYGLVMGTDGLGRQNSAGAYATGATYHALGGLKQFTYGNGITFSQSVDGLGRPTSRSDINPSAPASRILDYGYSYDGNGNLLRLTDALGVDARDMTYDDLDRLIGVSASPFAPTYEGNSSYSYDTADNITSWTMTPFGSPTTYSYSHDSRGRVSGMSGGGVSAAYEYDRAGRMKKRGVIGKQSQHSYDGLGQMLTSTGADRVGNGYSEAYAYDAFGHRTVTTNLWTGAKTYDVWTQGGQRLYSEDQRDGKQHRFMYLGGRLVAETKKPIAGGYTETLYHHTDHIGSALRITRADRSIVDQGNSDSGIYRSAYGRIVVGQESNGPGYAGHIGDRASDLTYMKARYYDSMVMRFTSPDPVDVMPSTGGNFNRYWYANNNPYGYVDSDGRWAIKVIKFIAKGGNFTATVAGIVDDYNTMTDPSASTGSRIIAGVSLATEVLPVSIGDIKDVGGAARRMLSDSSKVDSALKKYNQNDKHHLFGRGGEAPAQLLEKFGGPDEALQSLQEAAQGIATDSYKTGTWVSVDVEGIKVAIKGKVIDGEFRISSIAKEDF